jgi:hypothetical protein
MSAGIAIELPDDPAKRKAFFEEAKKWGKVGQPAPRDVGQRWILFHMHL